MPFSTDPRLILAVPAWPAVRAAYESWNISSIEAELKERIDKVTTPRGTRQPNLATQFEVVALPSNAPIPSGLDISTEEFRRMLVYGIVMTGGPQAAEALAASVHTAFGPEASIGADLAVSPPQDAWSHWCPGEAAYGLFGDRTMALRTMEARQAQLAGEGLPGQRRVNLVFVDTGLPSPLLPGGPFKGWPVIVNPSVPGSPVREPGNPVSGHGAMVALNARAVVANASPTAAQNLTLLDCPVIPDGITDFPVFLHSVTAALFHVASTISWFRLQEPAASRTNWVICNAWGVFDPRLEPPQAPYANNPAHPAAIALKLLNFLSADVVFAAGNCGRFCPNARCDPDFTGPGRSINGANALAEVLTVGAVRNDKLWLGYSGQGPGIAGMTHDKPDLCAPSQFENETDAGPNTGTSAACGLAAGAVALLRTKWRSSVVGPGALRTELRSRAVQPYGAPGWQSRTGYGILDLASTAQGLGGVAPRE